MSRGEQLFVRGMTSDHSDNDMWNDTALVKAYEKAMRSYKPVDMAQRIAMATNCKNGAPARVRTWRVGAPCRAIYEEDGLEYEAFVLEILNKEDCVVRFIGYDEDAEVKLNKLKPSLGNAARSEQVHNITTEPSWKEIRAAAEDGSPAAPAASAAGAAEHLECKAEAMECEQDDVRSVDTGAGLSTDKQSKRAKKKNNKKYKKSKGKKRTNSNPLNEVFDDLPKLPFNLTTDFATHFNDMGGHLGAMPFPPPVLPPAADADDDEQEALNNLLTAWYMSGYYAGLYQSRLKNRTRIP